MPKWFKVVVFILFPISLILTTFSIFISYEHLTRTQATNVPPGGVVVTPVFTTNNQSNNNIQMTTFGFATGAPQQSGTSATGSGNTGAQATVGQWIPPNVNNCGGKYNLARSKGKNYGDPNCTFTKDKLFTLLKQLDPANASKWFMKIVPCESGYNPVIVGWPPGQAQLDAGGAWGLYQMGSSTPHGRQPPAPGKNGPYDRGDVNWEMQTSNAIDYNKKRIRSSFAYWACAR